MALSTGNDPASFLIDNQASILQTPRAYLFFTPPAVGLPPPKALPSET